MDLEQKAGPGLAAYDLLDTPPERGFDDIVILARQICQSAAALVSLLDHDRQWFKARSGLSLCETSLDQSVCRLVAKENTYLEIPDLTLDPRTKDNDLVTRAPHIRFYAGMPLCTPFGTIGALCVIDFKPRPEGLLPQQQSMLGMLARQVVDLIELRRHTTTLAAAEARWRTLFQFMEEGFFLARVIRDRSGTICDWRFEEVNPAWQRHIGLSAHETLGRSCHELFPDDTGHLLGLVQKTVETRIPVDFLKEVRTLGRWYEGVFKSVDGETFLGTFRDVTGRITAENRQAGLVQLADLLQDERDTDKMISHATAIIGKALNADRATYGELDHDISTINVSEGWASAAMPPIAGIYRFDDYGRLRDTLLLGKALIIDDVMTDLRTQDEAQLWRALKARSVINIPVRENGRTVALLLVHHSHPHRWTQAELHWMHNAADRIEVAIARRRAEDFQIVVNGEIAHRLRNTLAMVQAIARMTLRNALSPAEATRFSERLQALGRAHDLLHGSSQRAAYLGELAMGVVTDAGAIERCMLSGPVIHLGDRSAMSTALLLHEMTMNAIKHGALSVPDGRVSIVWHVGTCGKTRHLTLEWRETGGPVVVPPQRSGFGSRLVSSGLIGTGGVDLRYEEEGLYASFRADIDKLERT